MLEERLQEIAVKLTSLNDHLALLKKDHSQPSPGLKQAIATLRFKQENTAASIELWRTLFKVYPNYDR